MTQADNAFWLRVQRRAADLQPEIQVAILHAFQIVRDALSDEQLDALIAAGGVELVFRKVLSDVLFDRAFIPLRQRLRNTTERGFKYAVQDLPKAGKVNGTVSVMFDHLNPDVITAIRDLETKVVTTLKDDIRETVKAYIENGLRDGVNPRAISRDLRSIIGLAPNQEQAVSNFERALRGENPNASPTDYALRDKRFDRLLAKADELTEKQIETMTAAYRRKMLAFNAETNARTASLDAMKVGQQLSWRNAVEKGIVSGGSLTKRWSGVLDDRERPEHLAMQGETVGWDDDYSNGEYTPGDSTFNCRCVSIFRSITHSHEGT